MFSKDYLIERNKRHSTRKKVIAWEIQILGYFKGIEAFSGIFSEIMAKVT